MARSKAKRSQQSKAQKKKTGKMVAARTAKESEDCSSTSSSSSTTQQPSSPPLAANVSASARKLSYFVSPSCPISASQTSSLPVTVVDLNCLNGLFDNLSCMHCGSCSLHLQQGEGSKSFAVHLRLVCAACGELNNQINTSKKAGNMCDINHKVVATGLAVGIGHTGLQKLAEGIGMPGMHHRSYLRHMEDIFKCVPAIETSFLEKAREKVFSYYRQNDPSAFSNGYLHLAVSFDGSWPKRGHTSKLGCGAVIDVMTDLAVDFHVLSLYCQVCATTGAKLKARDESVYTGWLEQHKANGSCTSNYVGSSGGMECAAALHLWKQSERHGMRYTTLVEDGDTKTHLALSREKPYGDTHLVQKEECVNHFAKRLNTGLRNLKSTLTKQSIRIGGNAPGSLTDAKTGLLQSYYTKAVRSNNGSVVEMQRAIWASFHHSTDQHNDCPKGKESWCWFQRDVASGITAPELGLRKQSMALNPSVAKHVKGVYERLTSADLLSCCLLGKTQNTNESLHSLIWMRCPKHLWAGYKRVYIACLLGVGEFNMGSLGTRLFLNGVRCHIGEKTIALGSNRNRKRVVRAEEACQAVAKKRRETWKLAGRGSNVSGGF